VIQRRKLEFERSGAVHAAAATVAHRSALDRALLMARSHNLPPP